MTNISSLNAQEANKKTNFNVKSSLEKLSTGYKINKASDDGSGLAIADKLRTHANSLNQAIDNGNSAIALLQIADKAMAEQSNIIDRVKQKLIQAATDTTSDEGLFAIGKDINKLLTQLDKIANTTHYNGTYLLLQDATTDANAAQFTFQLGASDSDIIQGPSTIKATNTGLATSWIWNASAYWVGDTFSQGSLNAERDYIRNTILPFADLGLTRLNSMRADYGSTQNQVESAVRNLMTQVTNTKAAEAVIREVDYAQESANYNKQNIIAQAGTYAISQANSAQQNVLRLLQ